MKKLIAVLLAVLLAATCGACSKDPSAPADASVTEEAGQDRPESSGGLTAGAALEAAFEAGKVVFVPKAFAKPDPATCKVVAPPEEAWGIVQNIRTENEGDETGAKAAIKTSVQVSGPGIRKRNSETQTPAPVPEPAAMDEAAVRDMLAKGKLTIRSYSPDGKHGVGYLATEEMTVPVAVSEDTVAVVYPSRTRGAEDTYGTGEAYYRACWAAPQPGSPMGMGREGMIWSPDGRYCCGLNGEIYRKSGNHHANGGMPAVVDTQTGEMFLLDAYSNNLLEKEGCFMTEGFFSEDGQYFYGAVFGIEWGEWYALVRYNLATCEEEKILDLPSDMLTVAMLPDERILMLSDKNRKAKLSEDDSPYYSTLVYAGDGEIRETLVIPLLSGAGDHELVYSRASGTGLLLSSTKTIDMNRAEMIAMDQPAKPGITMYALSVIDPRKSLAENLETLWMVFGPPDAPRITGMEAEQFATLREAQEYFFPPDKTGSGQDGEKTEQPWMILETELSPDGRYAALAAVSRREESPDGNYEARLLVVRLSDMKMIAAEGLEAYTGADSVGLNTAVWYSQSYSLLNWSEAGLIIHTGTGSPVLWQLEGLD